MSKVISICKDGVRYDMPLNKQEPIASDEPVISEGAIVSLRGHKGKVLQTEGDQATVSWEDAALSKVPIKSLKYEGRVQKGGPGSGPRKGDLVEHPRQKDWKGTVQTTGKNYGVFWESHHAPAADSVHTKEDFENTGEGTWRLKR